MLHATDEDAYLKHITRTGYHEELVGDKEQTWGEWGSELLFGKEEKDGKTGAAKYSYDQLKTMILESKFDAAARASLDTLTKEQLEELSKIVKNAPINKVTVAQANSTALTGALTRKRLAANKAGAPMGDRYDDDYDDDGTLGRRDAVRDLRRGRRTPVPDEDDWLVPSNPRDESDYYDDYDESPGVERDEDGRWRVATSRPAPRSVVYGTEGGRYGTRNLPRPSDVKRYRRTSSSRVPPPRTSRPGRYDDDDYDYRGRRY